MAVGPVRRVVVALGACVLLGGCGGGTDPATTATTPGTTPRATATATAPLTSVVAARHGPIPPALRTAESAAEDTIDLALAGRRRRVIAKARALRAVADGPAGPALRAAGVSEAQIAEFRTRAQEVARLAPTAGLLRVALASNRAFALVAGFFAHFESRIPAQVSALDHLDFEEVTSGAFADNPASLGVSRKVGYRDNGKTRLKRRDADRAVLRRLVLQPDDLIRGDLRIEVEGLAEVRAFIGLDG